MRDMNWERFKNEVMDEITTAIYDYTYVENDGDNFYVGGGYDASTEILNILKKYSIWSEK